MDTNPKDMQAGRFLRTNIAITILISATSVFASCCANLESISSKPPLLAPLDSQPVAADYLGEFRENAEPYYWVPISPDQKWELYIQRENSESHSAGFYSFRLRANASGDSRILFTLWDADVGSGVRAHVRWSKDAKALQLKGDTRGFTYAPTPDAMKYQSFNFIYLVEEDKFFALLDGGV